MRYLSNNKRQIYLVIIVLLILATSGLVSAQILPLQAVDNDGFLEKDNEVLQVVDFDLEQTTVSKQTEVSSRLILGNYGKDNINDLTFKMDIDRTHIVDDDGNLVPDVSDHDDVLKYPDETYETDIDAGKNREYTHVYDFDGKQRGIYNIKVYSNTEPTDMPVAQQTVRVISSGEDVQNKSFEDRSNSSKKFTSVQMYKDENSPVSSSPLSTLDIPPIEMTADGFVDEVDVAKGTVISFNNMRKNTTSKSATIERTGSDIKTGFYFEGLQKRDHYGLNLKYEVLDSPDLEELDIDIVDSSGDELDKNTTYRLNNEGSGIKDVNYHLSSKEYNYISNRSETYIVFNGEDFSGDIKLYSMQIISSNNIYEVSDDDLEVSDMEISPNNPEVGDRVSVTADITNSGGGSVQRNFNLYESKDDRTITKSLQTSREKIINPGKTKTVRYSIVIKENTNEQMKILDKQLDINIDTGGDTTVVSPNLVSGSGLVGVGQNVDLTITDFGIGTSRINQIDWDKGSDGSTDYTTTSLSKTMSFSSEGDKSVTATISYEDEDGNTVETSTSASVEVIGQPDIDLSTGRYYLDVNDQNDQGGTVISSAASGNIYSQTCMGSGCSSEFNYLSQTLPTTSGINMLVLSTDWEEKSYQTEMYGLYQVNKGSDGTSAEINGEITEDKIEELENDLTGDGGDPSQRLINQINSYTSGSGQYYIVLFSGGDAKPEITQSSLYDKLNDIKANLGRNSICNMGSGECKFEDNSIWKYIVKVNDGSVVPLFEEYKEPETASDSMYNTFSLEPRQITGDLPPQRSIYYDISDSDVIGGLDDPETDIDWTFESGSVSDQITVQKKYSTGDTEEVEVEIRDKIDSNADSTLTRGFTIGTSRPSAKIETDKLRSGEKGTVSASSSYDSMSAIVDYTWSITDPDGTELDTKYGYKINKTWEKSGEYEIQLTVTSAYGNTKTTTKTVTVSAGAPAPDVDIRRVTGEFSDDYSQYRILENPSVHYTFNKKPDGKYYDATGNTVLTEGNKLPSDNTPDYKSVSVDTGNSNKIVIDNNNALNHKEFTVSTWVKSSTVGNIGEIIRKEGGYNISIDNQDLIFSDYSKNYTSDDIELNSDEWNHIAVTIGTNIQMYVNGERTYNKVKPNTVSVDSTNDLVIGGKNNQLMSINEFRFYDNPLSSEELSSIYENGPEFEYNGPIDFTIYKDGTEYVDLSTNVEGTESTINKKLTDPEYIEFNLDSTDGSDSTGYIRTQEKIDLGNYDTIYMEYDRTFKRNKINGEPEAGHIALHRLDPSTTYGVPGDDRASDINGVTADAVDTVAYDKKSGVMSLDVSGVGSENKITVFAKSHGSNKGTVELKIYEIWASESETDLDKKSDIFKNGLYPEKVQNMKFYQTRDGVGIKSLENPSNSRLISNLYSSSDSMISYSIDNFRTGSGYNIYGESSGSYSIEDGISRPIELMACSGGSPPENVCSKEGRFSERLVENTVQFAESAVSARTDPDGRMEYKSLRISGDNTNTNIPTVLLDARDSSADGDRKIVKYKWDIKPTTTFNTDKTGPIARHKFENKGEHIVSLKLIDSEGGETTESYSINVENTAPEVYAIAEETAKSGDKISFNLDITNVGDQNIREVKLLTGDGSTVKTTDTTSDLTYTYDTSGVYKYTVVAVDESGLTGTYQDKIKIKNDFPDLGVLDSSISAHVKDTIFLDATELGSVSDVPDDVTTRYDATDIHETYSGDMEFTWNLPDGTEVTDPTASFTEDELIDSDNSKTITLEIENEEGLTISKDIELTTYNSGPTQVVSVSGNSEPSSSSTIASVYPNENIEALVTVNHPHDRIDLNELSADIGEREITETLSSNSNTFTYTKSFDPTGFPDTDSIQKDINVQVTDEYGDTSDNYQEQIEIIHSGVTINDFTSSEGTEVNNFDDITFTADVSAPASDELDYKFTFSDGTDSGSQNSNTYEHSFDSSGTKNVEVFVEDGYSYSDTATLTIEVDKRSSCLDILNQDPSSSDGYYDLKVDKDTTVNRYCDMSGGGWTRIVDWDATNDPNSEFWNNAEWTSQSFTRNNSDSIRYSGGNKGSLLYTNDILVPSSQHEVRATINYHGESMENSAAYFYVTDQYGSNYNIVCSDDRDGFTGHDPPVDEEPYDCPDPEERYMRFNSQYTINTGEQIESYKIGLPMHDNTNGDRSYLYDHTVWVR